MRRRGMVNVRMVITEEKVLSNIDKVQKMINPKSKKQIVKLEEDTYFKDMVEAIKAYLIEYPEKKNFPAEVYNQTYGLVEFAINQFEENSKKIEELIGQREKNIILAKDLKRVLDSAIEKDEDFESDLKEIQEDVSEDIVSILKAINVSESKEEEEYSNSVKLINARINNLEGNLHIEIDMERVTDRSKALSYIGIEVAEALKQIPAPVQKIVEEPVEEIVEEPVQEVQAQYIEENTFETKMSLWQRIKNSKIVRAIRYITRIKVVLELPGLPEGNQN